MKSQVQPLRVLCAVSEGNGLMTVPYPLISLALWEPTSTTQGASGCAGAVTPVSLEGMLWVGVLSIRLLPSPCPGDGPIPFCSSGSLSLLLSVPSKVCWPLTTE